MTRFENILKELNIEKEFNTEIGYLNGTYTGMTEAIYKITCEILLSDVNEDRMFSEVKPLIIAEAYKNFAYLKK